MNTNERKIEAFAIASIMKGTIALILALLMVVILSLTAFGADVGATGILWSWEWQNPLPQGNPLFGVSAVSSTTAWAAGNSGTILRTTDGGSNWDFQDSGTTKFLWDVSAIDSSTVWAVGYDGTILHTTDGGSNWNPQASGTTGNLRKVSPVDSSNAWVVGYDGIILHTTDGGSNWNPQASGTSSDLIDLSAVNSSTAWAVGCDETILYTTDGGSNWNAQDAGIVVDLFGVSAVNSSTAWAVGQSGIILHTTDGGSNWSKQDSGTSMSLYCVSPVSSTTVWTVGRSGTILHTTDGGSNWNNQVSGTNNDLYFVSAFGSSTAWAVGNNGVVFRTTDGGLNWDPKSSGTTNRLFGISAGDSNTAWIVGELDSILHTTDGGSNWDEQNSGTIDYLNGVSAIDSSTAWAVGNYGAVVHTTNGGSNWNSQESGTTRNLYDVIAVDFGTAWAVGSSGTIIHTTDGGSNWGAQGSGTDKYLYGISTPDSNCAWAVGMSGTILHTTDGGLNWSAQDSRTNKDLYGVSATDSSTAWAVGMSGTILYTTDGGLNWNTLTSGTSSDLMDVSAVDSSTAWAVGYDGTILHTTDGGSNWGAQDTGTTNTLRSVSAVDSSNAWAVGYGGTVLHGAYAAPTLTSIYPGEGVNTGEVNVTNLKGTGFRDGATVKLRRNAEITASSLTVVSATTITCKFNLSGAAAGAWNVYVENDDGKNDTLTGAFTVKNPAPSITSTSPGKKKQGEGAFTLTVNGTGFVNTSKVRWNGSERATTFVSGKRLRAAITADDLKTAGNVTLVVGNPSPGGGISNGKTFAIENTPTGKNVSVDVDNGTTLEFDRVNTSGVTTRTNNSSDDPDFQIEGHTTLVACNISTTATFEGIVKMALSYPDQGDALLEKQLKIYHKEEGVWKDVTTGVDTDNNVVCGEVTSLSPVAVVIPSRAGDTWYLAEGTCAWGFDCYITIANPNNEQVTADITYQTPEGPVAREPLVLAPLSQTTVVPLDDIGHETDFSTKVIARRGKAIAVDRTMSWTGEGAPSPDGHCSIGVTSPSTLWYLPEGCTAYDFETWLLIQNTNDTDATVAVTYMTENCGDINVEKVVPANTRRSYDVEDDIGEKNVSIMVKSDIGVIPERSMYRHNRREGHDSIGTTDAAGDYRATSSGKLSCDYFLAEGTTDHGFTTYIEIQNPNNGNAEITLTYMTEDGPVQSDPFIMSPLSRSTVRVNDEISNEDLSTRVHADKPIVAERAMYWGEDTDLGEAAHGTIGTAEAHTTFYFPDGQTSDGRVTYTLVQNPNDEMVEVEVTYLPEGGTGKTTFTDTIDPQSRKTFNMVDYFKDGRASIVVKSLTDGKKITAERAMYWNNRGAGTCTIGSWRD